MAERASTQGGDVREGQDSARLPAVGARDEAARGRVGTLAVARADPYELVGEGLPLRCACPGVLFRRKGFLPVNPENGPVRLRGGGLVLDGPAGQAAVVAVGEDGPPLPVKRPDVHTDGVHHGAQQLFPVLTGREEFPDLRLPFFQPVPLQAQGVGHTKRGEGDGAQDDRQQHRPDKRSAGEARTENHGREGHTEDGRDYRQSHAAPARAMGQPDHREDEQEAQHGQVLVAGFP
ncbi:hypothetical protein QE394_002936 [Arthrobacter sp. SORGH_AS 212]|uniref:hypothetical protein n=1 Tax=Pseudarthrobacter sp. SORGH_AS 212 TaxID=3041777 RepID=UPI002780BB36|nr:hypothetical protein [Arthrobacter sp. SORGH_AS_0212]